MPNYTLHYFNGRGRAEILRMMMAMAGVKYMDKRYEFSDWDRCRNDLCLVVRQDLKSLEAERFVFFGSQQPESKVTMPNYTLHYFNGRGRAEILRMMMAMAGLKYMDKRYEFSDWDRCRNDFPCNYLPCLQMDNGDMMPETMAICRYLAREHSFYPKSPMDMMRCDYICDCFYEIMHDYMRYYHWKNGNFRYNMNDYGFGGESNCSNYDNYMYWRYMNTFNRVMPFMERTLGMRNGGSKFFMGDMMMWCDMMFYCCMESMYNEIQSMLNNYPKLMSLYSRVASHPKVAGYLKSRCNTPW